MKEAGLAGTVGGAVEVDPALADGDVEAGATGPDAGEEVMVPGAVGVNAAAVPAMEPLRSHGFGGEAISQIGGSKVHRNTGGWVDSPIRITGRGDLLKQFVGSDRRANGQTNQKGAMRKSLPPEVILLIF